MLIQQDMKQMVFFEYDDVLTVVLVTNEVRYKLITPQSTHHHPSVSYSYLAG